MVISSLLIANRGEIAVRIIRTCRRMGIRSVAVYSDADREALHVRSADEAVRIGPPSPRESYLNAEAIIEAAHRTGATAIHPGYGFLSEKPILAELAARAGLVFVGPSAEAIRTMGSKIGAKAIAGEAGVTCVPGYSGADQSPQRFQAEADAIGYPVMVKASAGGGGKGMRAVFAAGDLLPALELARREAKSAFGDPTLLLEKLVMRPRHLEVQVAGDRHGALVHLFERDCSVQRNHQKLLEEAPAPNLPPEVREKLLTRAVKLARAIGYDNLGTVEFILEDGEDEPWFLEMNTRLQVEHPVTEAVTGLDLVEWQIRIAAGERLPLNQAEIPCRGHAIEARVTAESAEDGFRPDVGPVLLMSEPASARVDSGVSTGSVVSSHYDSLLAKVIGVGIDREEARCRLELGLRDFLILGPATTLPFLADAVAHPIFRDGRATTQFLDDAFPGGWRPKEAPEIVLATAAVLRATSRLATDFRIVPASPWKTLRGFRILGPAGASSRVRLVLDAPTGRQEIEVDSLGESLWRVTRGDRETTFRLSVRGDAIEIDDGGRVVGGRGVVAGDRVHLALGRARMVFDLSLLSESSAGTRHLAANDGQIRSPMPGIVSEILVTPGEPVAAEQVVAVVESMKLFISVASPIGGEVLSVDVRPGDAVAVDQPLMMIAAHDAPPRPQEPPRRHCS